MTSSDKTFSYFIQLGAEKYPARTYLQTVDGETLSYEEAYIKSIKYAHALRKLGVTNADQVAMMLPQGIDAVLVWIACCWVGARRVCIEVNPEFEGLVLQQVLANSKAKIVFTQSDLLSRLQTINIESTLLTKAVITDTDSLQGLEDLVASLKLEVISGKDFLLDIEAKPIENESINSDIGSITYTSGTTGVSKGVVLHWPHFHGLIEPSPHALPHHENTCFYVPYPPSWSPGQTPVYCAAALGCRAVLRNQLDFSQCMEDIRRFQCTEFFMPQFLANFIMSQPRSKDDISSPLESVFMLGIADDVQGFIKRFSIKNLTYGYGMTELGIALSETNLSKSHLRGLCGRPTIFHEASIVDSNDEPVETGQIGELVIRPVRPWTVISEYFGQPELSVHTNRNNWFHTGDAFYSDNDGDFFFVDRIKDLIHLSSGPVSSILLERLAREVKNVFQSAAVGVKEEGQNFDQAKIFVQPAPGAKIVEKDLFTHLKNSLPEMHHPMWIEFIDKFPRTASLKIRKPWLREKTHGPSTWIKTGKDYQPLYENLAMES